MPYSAKAVANTFLDLAEKEGRTLASAKLQRLVFLAHGFQLFNKGEDFPLVDEGFIAADEGPILPTLHQALLDCGNTPCRKLAEADGISAPRVPDGVPEMKAISVAWEAFKDTPSTITDRLVRTQNSAWAKTWAFARYTPIPTEGIADYIRESMRKVRENRQRQAHAAA
jgi:uncharacterized phage-associated protein